MLFINIPTVSGIHDENDKLTMVNGIQNPIASYTKSVQSRLSLHGFDVSGVWKFFECINNTLSF